MKVLARLGAESLSTQFKRCSESGFTLVEKIAVMAILGTLMAIAAPSWVAFFNARSLNAAQDTVFQTIRLAQIQAEQKRSHWQFSIRTDSYGFVQVAAHPTSVPIDEVNWKDLESEIQLHPESREMTLYYDRRSNVYHIRFNHLGRVQGLLGQVALIRSGNFQTKRCVRVSTLLGTVHRRCIRP